MKRRAVLLLLLSAVFVVSCDKKDDPVNPEVKPFVFDGNTYSTLQEAVSALVMESEYSINTIVLTEDASGDGAVFPSGYNGFVLLDFQDNNYTLNPGKSINISDNTVCFSSQGGSIITSDGTPAIEAQGGSIQLMDDMSLNGETIIKSAADIFAGIDFTGKLKGNVILNEALFSIGSASCDISIPVLTVNGENACLSSDAEVQTNTHPIVIGKYISDQEYPIVAHNANAINLSEGTVHIHNFVTINDSFHCLDPGRIEYVCPDCGYEKIDYDESITEVHCNPVNLVHHEAREALYRTNGNVEYWECPYCGRCYSDPDGKDELLGGPVLFAGAIEESASYIHRWDDILNWENEFTDSVDPSTIGILIGVVSILETLGLSLPGLIKSDAEKWAQVNSKLDKIQNTLNEIIVQLNVLVKKINNVHLKDFMTDRNNRLNYMRVFTFFAFDKVSKIAVNKELTEEQKKEQIIPVIKTWADQKYNGSMFCDMTTMLVLQYHQNGTGLTVPEIYERIVNENTIWEHDGYNTRYQMMVVDLVTIGLAYALEGIYIKELKEYADPEFRDIEHKALLNSFKNGYAKTLRSELDRIKSRNDKYRHYNINDITFNRSVNTKIDFAKWFEDHSDKCFPRNNDGGKAAKSCVAILDDMQLNRNFLTPSVAKTLFKHYNKKAITQRKPTVSIYKILKDSCGFKSCPDKFDPELIFTYSNSGWKKDGDWKATYLIFHWIAYRWASNGDFFGINTCLDDNADLLFKRIRDKMDIDSHSGGNIQNLGEKTNYIWNTITVADEK